MARTSILLEYIYRSVEKNEEFLFTECDLSPYRAEKMDPPRKILTTSTGVHKLENVNWKQLCTRFERLHSYAIETKPSAIPFLVFRFFHRVGNGVNGFISNANNYFLQSLLMAFVTLRRNWMRSNVRCD